ncbi:MAG: ribbon-helix-helix protein, CopG family [Acidobacteria bacterium]|nr:ribbon-helix-helix protein, CopG family [Acidobacteriota bacterium]
MKRIIIQVEDDTLAELDEAAREEAESRARFVRRAIEAALAERCRHRELQRVVRSFRRRPPGDLTASKAAVRRAWPD